MNRSVPNVGGWEVSKGEEPGKGEEQVKYNSVSKGKRKRPKILWNLKKEVATEAYQKSIGSGRRLRIK